MNFVAVYLKVAFTILDSGDSSNTLEPVSAAVYESLGKSLRHHTAAMDGRIFEDIVGFIARGMKNPNRSVRLAAG